MQFPSTQLDASLDASRGHLLEAQARVSDLYESLRDGIYRFLQTKGLSPSTAQEITQDVFVDLFVAMRRGIHIESERAWLFTVASRAAADHWRRERPRMWVELDSDQDAAADVASEEESPAASAEYKERLRTVTARLTKLSRERQLCLQLRMRGLRYREIAKIMHVSTSTIAEWLAAAVEHLREG